jgi:hypothetical protein
LDCRAYLCRSVENAETDDNRLLKPEGPTCEHRPLKVGAFSRLNLLFRSHPVVYQYKVVLSAKITQFSKEVLLLEGSNSVRDRSLKGSPLILQAIPVSGGRTS